MLRLSRTLFTSSFRPSRALTSAPRRLLATQLGDPQTAAAAPPPPAPIPQTLIAKAKRVAKTKDEGNISSVFASLSGEAESVLPDRFIELKKRIINPEDKELVEKVTRSWASLLQALERETDEIRRRGPDIVPQIEFSDLAADSISGESVAEIRKRGCFVLRGVIPEAEAVGYNDATTQYCKVDNKDVIKGFPEDDKMVFESYWSPAQLKARSHPNLIQAQSFANQLWHTTSTDLPVDLSFPVTYADRLRQRKPGDAKFALGPHVDAGSLERWEDPTYMSAFKRILEGEWEKYDAWDCEARPNAVSDLYGGSGACAVWRAFQGWLALSHTGPNEGTLEVFPNITLTTAGILLRPFFSFKLDPATATRQEIYNPDNWYFDVSTSAFPNSAMGRAQEMNRLTHPHMSLDYGMTSIPKVAPGDAVFWHGDGVHAVSATHIGQSESSVFYIPAVPLTPSSAGYVAHQRSSFRSGSPPEDFPGSGGVGERDFVGKGVEGDIHEAGRKAMGFGVTRADEEVPGLTMGQVAARRAFREALEEQDP